MFTKFKLSSLLLTIFLGVVFFAPHPAQAQLYKSPDGCQRSDKDDIAKIGGIRLQVNIPGVAKGDTYYALQKADAEGSLQLKCGPVTIYTVPDIQTYIQKIYDFFIGAIALSAVIMIMIGGFQWVLAGGNQQRIGTARSIISGALGGLVLSLLSYTILHTVNPRITSLDIEQPQKIDAIARGRTFCANYPDSEIEKISSDGKIFYSDLSSNLSTILGDAEIISEPSYVTKKETLCGFLYAIKGTQSSCLGEKCDPGVCLQGSCKDVILGGGIINSTPNRYINNMDILAICISDDRTQASFKGFNVGKSATSYAFPAPVDLKDFAADPFIPDCPEDKTKFALYVDINDPSFTSFDDLFLIGNNGCGSNTQPIKQGSETDPEKINFKNPIEGEFFTYNKASEKFNVIECDLNITDILTR